MANANRVKETTTATSLATIALGGAVASFRTFAAGLATGVKRTGIKVQVGPDANGAWLIGVYDLTTDSTLTRRAILDSSANGADVTLAAGSKEVSNTISAGQGDKWDNSTSTRVVYLSNYVDSDTDLSMYSPVAGVDQRAKIQAVLDLPGSLRLVWDVKVTLANRPDGSGDTLRIHGNTEIIALNGCGALQAAGSTGRMFLNANPTVTAQNSHQYIVDENIKIDGGIWHGNVSGQTGKNDVFNFFGVRNLVTKNYKIIRASGMAHRCINVDQMVNSNYLIDFGAGNTTPNTDGMHFHGPLSGLRDHNGKIYNCGDDSFALNADDAWGEANFTGPYDNVYGPIQDVKVSNLTFNAALFGVRLLSGASRLTDITFTNTNGATTGYGFLIDNYLNPPRLVQAGPGNFGAITIDGWNVKTTYHTPGDAAEFNMAMHITAKVEQLNLLNILKRDFNNQLYPAIRIGAKADIDQLRIGYMSRNYNGGTYLTDQIEFVGGAKVNQAIINSNAYSAAVLSGSVVRIRSGASVSQLLLSGIATNFTSMLLNEGFVGGLHDTSFVDGQGANWVTQAGAPWAQSSSSTDISYNGPYPGIVAYARRTPLDTFGGNVQLSNQISFGGGSKQSGLHAALIVRGTNIVTSSSTARNCYGVDIQLDNGGSFSFFKFVNGTQSGVGAGVQVGFELNTAYRFSLTAKTNGSGVTTLSATAQRVSDSFWLQPNGTWAAAAATALTATDSSLPAAASEYGYYAYNEANNGVNIGFTQLSIVAAP
jgi:hypothetical protein